MCEFTQSTKQLTPHVMIVDDEPDIRHMVMLCLQKNNFRVTCAESAAEAFALLDTESFDAIVSDVMMPGEDGIAFLGRVHVSWPELPVILMTGHAQLQMAVDAIKNGAFDFIRKPFDIELLVSIVSRAANYRNLQRIEKNYRSELEAAVARRTAELKASLEELDSARVALQEAATEKGDFMSTISHEMRTPMNGVIGALDLLAEVGLEGAATEYLAMARESAESMVTLINQLLSFHDLNFRRNGTQFRNVIDFKGFISSVTAGWKPAFARKNVNLSVSVADDLPVQIWTDREKLSRLLDIILGNAFKFTETGEVSLQVSRFYSDAEGSMVLCTITDSGVGIPDGMLERIFEPFVQGDGSLQRRHEGVGLGLAVARQNALLLNGKVWAEHVPSGGSRFNVAFKIDTPNEKEESREMFDC